MLIIKDAKSPRWVDEQQTQLSILVWFEGWSDYTPHVVSVNANYTHSKELYQKAIELQYGEIQPFVPPLITSDEDTVL